MVEHNIFTISSILLLDHIILALADWLNVSREKARKMAECRHIFGFHDLPAMSAETLVSFLCIHLSLSQYFQQVVGLYYLFI